MSPTEVCNMALARFGARRINDYGDASEKTLEAIYCRLFYEQTAKAFMRSFLWHFAMDQASLSQDTVSPTFQWSYKYHLPSDFLRLVLVYDGSDPKTGRTYDTYEIMGKHLYIEESTVSLKYIKWVSSEGEWDPLFVDAMVLTLARKLVIPLSQDMKLKKDIDDDLAVLMRQVRALDRQEQLSIGRDALKTWNDARYSDLA